MQKTVLKKILEFAAIFISAGIVISFPFLLYFLLQFVLPGLHENERKALFPAMAIGFGLFLAGSIIIPLSNSFGPFLGVMRHRDGDECLGHL